MTSIPMPGCRTDGCPDTAPFHKRQNLRLAPFGADHNGFRSLTHPPAEKGLVEFTEDRSAAKAFRDLIQILKRLIGGIYHGETATGQFAAGVFRTLFRHDGRYHGFSRGAADSFIAGARLGSWIFHEKFLLCVIEVT